MWMILDVPDLGAPLRRRLDPGRFLRCWYPRSRHCGSSSVLDSQGRIVQVPSEQDY